MTRNHNNQKKKLKKSNLEKVVNMSGAPELTDDLRTAMSDWVALKTQLAEARKDMKILNTREKELKEYIATWMKSTETDHIKLRKGQVSLKTSVRSGTMTRAAVERGLLDFFRGDEVQAEAALMCILDGIESRETTVISLTGVNKK